MAAQVGALRVAIGADITGLQTGMARAQREVSKGAGAMQRSIKSVNTSLAGLGTVAGVSLGAAGLLAGASAFLRVADAAKQLQAQLKLATAEYGSLERANKDVRSIAETTRSDLLATAELYAALQRNSGQLGTTQAQVARATQTVAEAFKISGAATSEQSAATRQLIQAFQSGVLRGDEFNSIMENAPRLAKLLADSLGVTTGQLRKMAEEGELTADKLVRAFTDKKFTEGLDREFKQLPVTFDEAMGQVYNAAIVVFSAFDRGGQFSTSIANFVSDGTEGFAQLEQSAYRFGEQVSDTLTAIETVRGGLAGLKTDGIGAFFGLIDATYSWRDALADTLGVIDGVANAFTNLFQFPANLGRMAFGSPIVTGASDLRGNFLEKTQAKRNEAARSRIMGRSVQDVLGELGLARNPPPFRAPPAKAKKAKAAKKGRAAPRDRSEDVSFQFEQELRQAQMDVLRAQQSLAVTSEDRARIALQLLDAERTSQEAELNDRVRRAERDFAEKKITAGALEQVKVQATQLRLEYDKTKALEIQKINEDLLADQARDRFELSDSGKDIQIELLQLESQLKTTAKERRDVELRILDAMKEQEKARLEAVIADKQATDLAKKQAQQRLDSLDSVYAGRAAGVVEGTKSPLEDYMSQLPTTTEKWNEALEHVAANGLQSVEDGIVDVLTGAKTVGEALQDILGDIIKQLIRIAVQKLIVQTIGGGMGGGFATGGFVSGPGTATSDSIPAMLSNGEFVMNTGAVRSFGPPFFDAINTGQLTPEMLAEKGGGGGGDMGFLKFLSPAAFLASSAKKGGVGGFLKALSPLALLGGKLFGFKDGGMVGGGLSVPKVSYGARVGVSNDNARVMRGGDSYHFSFPGVTNAREARQSGLQAANAFRGAVGRSAKVNG